MSETVHIGMTGDVMLGRKVDEYQRQRPPAAVWGDVLPRLGELDGLLVNLECCLSARGERWTRTHRPFHFRADPEWAVPALTAASVDCCALANNHVLDFETVALEDTLDHLDEADISHTGAGRDLDAALEPARFSAADLDVAVVAVTDNTPEYAATDSEPGVAHVEIDIGTEQTRTRVKTALARARKSDPDLLIASLHWGPNMVEEPPAAFEMFAQWLVDQGIDLIHGHSAHNFQGIEVIDGVPVLYDTGDFVDDYAVDRTLRNDRSFLFDLRLDRDGTLRRLRLYPTEIYDYSVHEASADTADWCFERLRELSEPYGTSFEREGQSLVLPL